jgi:putative DNA primase/helicase
VSDEPQTPLISPGEAGRLVLGYDPTTEPVPFQPRPLTDVGNAERLVDRCLDEVRFVPGWGCWMLWDGTRWRRDDANRIMEHAKATARAIMEEVQRATDFDTRKALATHAIRSESAARLQAMIDLAASDPGVVASAQTFDTGVNRLNLQNGTLNLKSYDFPAHQRSAYLTKLIPIEYHPNATCPVFERFLERILPDPKVRAFTQRALGYSLTGSTIEQCLFILWGSGANGKSTLLEVVRDIFGEYATSSPIDTFLAKRDVGIQNDLARLCGVRFVTAVESGANRSIAEPLIKQLTGGDTITARRLYEEFFEFRPTFKIWLATNHKPRIRGTDHAIWRRIRLIPFTTTIPDGEQDKSLKDKLKAEHPGILRWMIDGAGAWLRDGLGQPEAVASATKAYRAEQDQLAGFFDECCVTAPDLTTPTKAVYTAYVSWAESAGEQVFTMREFGAVLSDRGFTTGKSSGGVSVRTGIGLRDESRG